MLFLLVLNIILNIACDPKHIIKRIDEIKNNFRFKVLLILNDDENNLLCIQELNRIAFINNYTLILSFSNLECARYLETFRYYEGKYY